MKTKRLVSLLLSVLLASSSLPMAVSAAGAPEDEPTVDLSEVNVEIGEELLDDGNWTGIVSGMTVDYKEVADEGNKYLRVDNLAANSLYYRFGEGGGYKYPAGDYVLSFRGRTQSDEEHQIRMRFDGDGGAQLNFTKGTEKANVVKLTSEWATFTSDKFTMSEAFSGVHVWGGPLGKYISPVEYDDIVLTRYENNTPAQTWTYDFDNKAIVIYHNDSAKVDNGIEEEYSYYSVSKANTNKDYATYTPNSEIILEPGIYQLTGDVRMHNFYYASNHSIYNYIDADTGEADVAYKGIEHPADCELCAPHKDDIVAYSWDQAGKTALFDYAKTYKADNGKLPAYHMNYNNSLYDKDTLAGEYAEMAKDANLNTGAGVYHVLYKVDTGVSVAEAANYRGVSMNLNTAVYDAETTGWADAVVAPVAFDSNISRWQDSGGFMDDENTILKTTEAWSTFSKTIRINEYTKLNSIELGGTGYGYDIDPIDFRNVSLKQVDSFVLDVDESIDENVTIMDIIEADIASTGETGLGTSPSYAAGNNYITAYDRANNNDGLWVAFNNLPTEPKGEEYKVQFDIRAAVPVYKNGYKNMNYRVYSATATGHQQDALVGTPTPFYHGAWTTVSFNYDANIPYGFRIVGGGAIEANNNSNTAPFEIDNLRIVDKSGNVVAGYLDTLDNASFTGDYYTTPVATYKKLVQYAAVPEVVKIALDTEDVFYTAKFDSAEGELVYTFADDTVLQPGRYNFVAELRNSEYNFSNSTTEVVKDNYIKFYPDTTAYNGKRAAIVEDNNAFDYSIIAQFVDPETTEAYAKLLGEGVVTTGWGEVSGSFKITEATEVESLSISFEHFLADTDVENVKLSVDYKNFMIEYKPDDDTNGIPNVGIIMVLLSKKAGGTAKLPAKGMTAAIADGTTELGEAVTEFDVANFARPAAAVEVAENNYMTMVGRINNGDGITIKDAGLNLDASKSYELKFDIRTSTDVTKIGSNPDNLTMSRIWVVSANQNINPSYGSEWTTVTIPYEADKMATGYSVVGGIGATFSHPYDIDNVRIVEKGTDTVVASVDFEDVEPALLAETLAVNGFEFAYRYQYPDAENGKNAKISVEKDTSYAKATVTSTSRKAGSVSYAVEETVLQPGTYTLTLNARNGLYSGANTDLGKSNAVNFIMREPDDNTTKTRQRITANNNYVNLYAEVVTDTTVFTAKANTTKVYCAWTPIEFAFGVTEPVTVKSVNVCASHALLNSALAVTDATINVKDIVIWATDAEVIDIPVDGPETAEVEGNLIVNGDFDTAPTIVEGSTYDASKGNAWFQNDGEQYDTDANGQEMKEQGMIPFNHKITWNDGYLTFSGRENNLRQFWYNSGVTVEAGAYKLTLDVKTANAGEASSIRVAVPGLYNPTASDAVSIDNTWKTMTIEFTASAATAVRLNFWGGPSASYTHDFCVDNVVLVKVA